MDRKRLLPLAVIAAAIAAFFVFNLKQYLSLEFFQASRVRIDAFHAAHPWQTAAAYFAVYVAVTALSLPGATIMTLAGGAAFGVDTGTVLVSFASTIGATLAFLVSRFLLRDWVHARLGDRMQAIDDGKVTLV